MKMYGDLAEQAVLEIFVESGMSTSGRLSLAMLEREWPRWRLRARDLHEGLRQLEIKGWIRLDRDGQDVYVVLMRSGSGHTSAAPVRLNRLLDLFWRWVMMSKRSLRAQVKEDGPLGRRKSDLLTQQDSAGARR